MIKLRKMRADFHLSHYAKFSQQNMIESLIAIAIGLVFLIWSADRFVSASVSLALNLGMTPLMVGLTVVAFGTSAPELIVSGTAAFSGVSNLAVGNAIGSNIANIGLVLGCTALVSAIPIKSNILKLEFPILLTATGLVTLLLMDLYLSAIDGILLLIILFASLIALAKLQKSPEISLDDLEAEPDQPRAKSIIWLTFSLILLLLSSNLLVWGATEVATLLGVSELVIGLTIVAIGTSLPELAASIASALKGHHDLALGNVIGSNLFNLLAVLALPALIRPPEIESDVLWRDYSTMLLMTVVLAAVAYASRFTHHNSISRVMGAFLLFGYVAYLLALYQSAV